MRDSNNPMGWASHISMSSSRLGLITASRVDLVLIPLPLVGLPSAARSLAENDVPVEVAVRVLTVPVQRRAMPLPE